MRVVIHRFKCHSNLSVEFTQALVCGASGAGKTTLLEAVRFLLTGAGADDEANVECVLPECSFSRSTSAGLVGATQEWIDANFKFYADKSVNDILFPPDRPTPAELRDRCAAEIRDLESDLDQLTGGLEVMERDVGSPPQGSLPSAREYLYLKHKQFLYTSYVQKVSHYQQELATLQSESLHRVHDAAYTGDVAQLEQHVCAEHALSGFNWKEYLQYSVEDCREMVEEYSQDLERARNPYSPEAHQALEKEYNNMCIALLPCPSCETTLAVRNNTLFIATPTCTVVPYKQVADCKLKLDNTAARSNQTDQPEESTEYLAGQLSKWKQYLDAAEAIQRWRPALIDGLENGAELLHQIQHRNHIEERKANLIKWITRLNEEATRINLVDYSNTLAFDVDRYQELLQMRAAAEKVRQRKMAADRLQQMIQATEDKYRRTWLSEVEGRLNALCKQVFSDEFVVELSPVMRVRNRGLEMTPAMLSSGEFARYNLCYTLAIAQQCGSRILLLDEVLVHLDARARQRTLDMLRQQTGSMYLLFVAHEPTQDLQLAQTLHLRAPAAPAAALN